MSNKEIAIPDTGLDHNIAFMMASIIFRLDQDLRDTILRKLDLTYVHFRVLQYLYERDGQTIGEIARAIVVRQPVLSRVIDQMQERGLVRRKADRLDSRLMRVYLTAQGKARYIEAWPRAHKLLQDALQVLDAQEQEQMRGMLKRVADHICD